MITNALTALLNTLKRIFPVGTRSILFGAHAFWLHPFFVAAGWTKLYGFPFDPRLWVAFFVHDLGYFRCVNMDGPEGESHPELGARIMEIFSGSAKAIWPLDWTSFCLYHSRYYSKKYNAKPSRLCFADKLAFSLTPAWMYLPMTTFTGEINEYLKNAQKADSANWKPTGYDKRKWHAQLCVYMESWVEKHKDGSVDTWTSANRHARTDS